MPKLSVWMVRISLLHMGIGFFFGALLLFHKGVPFDSLTWRLLNPHLELMVFGWTMQFAMGIAFWILPRFSQTEKRYGNVRLGWISFVLLNTGVWITTIGTWFANHSMALFGRVLLIVSVLCFIALIWRRVKPFGSK